MKKLLITIGLFFIGILISIPVFAMQEFTEEIGMEATSCIIYYFDKNGNEVEDKRIEIYKDEYKKGKEKSKSDAYPIYLDKEENTMSIEVRTTSNR